MSEHRSPIKAAPEAWRHKFGRLPYTRWWRFWCWLSVLTGEDSDLAIYVRRLQMAVCRLKGHRLTRHSGDWESNDPPWTTCDNCDYLDLESWPA